MSDLAYYVASALVLTSTKAARLNANVRNVASGCSCTPRRCHGRGGVQANPSGRGRLSRIHSTSALRIRSEGTGNCCEDHCELVSLFVLLLKLSLNVSLVLTSTVGILSCITTPSWASVHIFMLLLISIRILNAIAAFRPHWTVTGPCYSKYRVVCLVGISS